MPIEFSVDVETLNDQLTPFFAGRARGKQAALDYVDVTASKDGVQFLTTGMASDVTAQVKTQGYGRLPYMIFETLFRRPQKLGQKLLLVRIEEGIIIAGPTTFKSPGITIRSVGARIADLPIDAPISDVLALNARFTPDELVDAGLWQRVLTAQAKASELIERAAKILEPLGIDQVSLTELAQRRITNKAAAPKENQ